VAISKQGGFGTLNSASPFLSEVWLPDRLMSCEAAQPAAVVGTVSCACSGSCKKHKAGKCAGEVSSGQRICADCLCKCKATCGRPECIHGCGTSRTDSEYCKKCRTGITFLSKEFAQEHFVNDALRNLLCNGVVRAYLSELPTRTLAFRTIQMKELTCHGCYAHVRSYSKKPPHSYTSGCACECGERVSEKLTHLHGALGSLAVFSEPKRRTRLPRETDNQADVAGEIVLDDLRLMVPQKSQVVGVSFQPHADSEAPPPTSAPNLDFVPRDDLYYPVGFLTTSLGFSNWFQVETFDERLRSMVCLFDMRRAIGQKSRWCEKELDLIKRDAALTFRITDGSRLETPVTQNAYKHYAANADKDMAAVHRLAELFVNAVLVRGTLSIAVRNALADGTFPYLRLKRKEDGGLVFTNLTDLDDFVWKNGGDIFGTFIDPMRTRKEELGDAGIWDLYIDLYNAAAISFSLAEDFLRDADVGRLLKNVRENLPGFNGTGFRAKEVVVDVADNCALYMDDAGKRAQVATTHDKVLVMGVGPCRTANWLFNKPFLFLMDRSMKEKEKAFVPALLYVVQRLRALYPDRYASRTYLDILYELCEFNKWLKAIYTPHGYIYVPTDYTNTLAVDVAAVMTSSEFSQLREKGVVFRRLMVQLGRMKT